MLKVKDLTKYYGEEKIFSRISFNIERGHKIALVGFNSVGKSTLLKILAGEETPDKGQIEIQKNIVVAFIPQDLYFHHNKNVLNFLKEYVGQDDEIFHRNIEIMFAGFALNSNLKNKKIGELSSGQKTKIFLTGILLKKPDLILLDEPTNNLDLPALIWLEDYLQKTRSAFIVVSHDRQFLSNVANKIYEINWQTKDLEISNGRYDDYLIRKEKEKKHLLLKHQLQKEDINRLLELAERKKEAAAKGAKYQGTDNDRMLRGYRRDKSKYSLKDSKVIYGRIRRMDKIEKPNSRKDFIIDIDPELSENSLDIVVDNLVCGYDDGFEIGPLNLEIKSGDRLCLLGLNGSGKTTFLKTLTGVIPKISGKISFASSDIKIGNLMQEHETLPKNKTMFNFMLDKTDLDKETIQEFLKSFGFKDSQINTKISILSSGARARLLLSYFSAIKTNILILDEPTNHLDTEAEEALLKSLDKFKGTVLIVTHDRSFIKKTKINKILVLHNGNLEQIKNFQQYLKEMDKKSKKLLRLLK